MWDKSKWQSFFRKIGRRPWLVLAGIMGILLLVLGSWGGGKTEETASTAETAESDSYRHALETQLAEACQQVSGVGRTQVIITMETGEQYLYEGSRLTGSIPPQVCGVVIICEGGGSDKVKKELTDLVCALCHITANRVHVAEMD